MGVNRLGNNMQDLFMDIARMKYAQDVQRQRMMQQEQLMQQRDQVGQAQIGRDMAASAVDVEKLASAKRFGDAMGRNVRGQMPHPLLAGQGPTVSAGREMESQDAFMQQVIEAAVLAGLSGNPQRASDFSANEQALRAVNPMGRRLGAAMLTNTRSAIPVASQGGVFNVDEGMIDAMMPQRPVASKASPSQAGQQLSKNNALTARMSPAYDELPDWLKVVLDQTITNQPNASVSQPMVAPQASPVPPPQQRVPGQKVRTAKGEFVWTGQGWEPIGPTQAAPSGQMDITNIIQQLSR